MADDFGSALSYESIGSELEVENPEFKGLFEGDSPNTPIPLRGYIAGRNKFMGVTIPRMDRHTRSGLELKAKDQVRPNACRLIKLSRDIATWEQDKAECFRELSDMRDMFKTEYNNGDIIKRGPTITYLPGNCQSMPFHCYKDDLVGEWEWLAPFYDKTLLNGVGGLEFVVVYGGVILNVMPYYEFKPVDNDDA